MAFGISSDDAIRILVEVTNDQPPAVKDTEAMKAYRERITAEVAQQKADGVGVDVPFEAPLPG